VYSPVSGTLERIAVPAGSPFRFDLTLATLRYHMRDYRRDREIPVLDEVDAYNRMEHDAYQEFTRLKDERDERLRQEEREREERRQAEEARLERERCEREAKALRHKQEEEERKAEALRLEIERQECERDRLISDENARFSTFMKKYTRPSGWISFVGAVMYLTVAVGIGLGLGTYISSRFWSVLVAGLFAFGGLMTWIRVAEAIDDFASDVLFDKGYKAYKKRDEQ
ncbi:hypothetical protein JYU10_00760, partial [bacterium AH-315-J04]|nr:hypothetical protein [bacterium AH-315-J04]